jgi:hypothetical protein
MCRQVPVRVFPILVAMVVAAFLAPGPVGAALDRETASRSDREIVVFEAGRSPYAQVFRDSILPLINSSSARAEAPVKFVDVLATATDPAGLSAPITQVPTLVLMRDGREVGRIQGLYGPSQYMKLFAALLGRP